MRADHGIPIGLSSGFTIKADFPALYYILTDYGNGAFCLANQ